MGEPRGSLEGASREAPEVSLGLQASGFQGSNEV